MIGDIYLVVNDVIASLRETTTDGDALDMVGLFAPWGEDVTYAVGDRIRYEDILYKCVQSHTSQSDWTPDITKALWTVVSIDEFPQWVQPTGAQDAYMAGDKVSHNEKHWISDVDANVWEPPTMWSEVI